MTLWIIISWTVMAFLWASVFYLANKMPRLFDFMANYGELVRFLIGIGLVLILGIVLSLFFNFVNAVVCIIYLGFVWAFSDFIFWIIQKAFHLSFDYYYSGWIAVILTLITFVIGWYLNNNVWQINYHLKTNKNVAPLKIAMFADAHLGTTFDSKGFEKHIAKIQAQNPDLLAIVGDFVDDETKKAEMIKACKILGDYKSKYGVFFVFGNHDKGYRNYRHFTGEDLIQELTKNNVKVLFDDVILLNKDFYLIGRKDYSEIKEERSVTGRLSMNELTKDLDKNKYIIVLDHQPTDYKNQAASEVDLVLSGHTHGGQLFPFNKVGKWIKANDAIYGLEHRNKTDFIVTSGISSWAIKFKTGTKSEYVIIDIEK